MDYRNIVNGDIVLTNEGFIAVNTPLIKMATESLKRKENLNQQKQIPSSAEQPKKKKEGRPKNNPNLPSMPVQPFKTEAQIQQAIEYFLSRPERYSGVNIRDCAIFIIGVNVLKRAGDLLNLTWGYVLDENYNIKQHLTVHEDKRDKITTVIVK